jgi:hypothetical protein
MTKNKFDQTLLVEGADDQHIIWALCQKFDVVHNFDVKDCKGIDNLFLQIPIILKTSGLKTLGVIIDADSDLNKRWNELKSIFLKSNISIPDILPNEGLILTNLQVKIGVWLMPDNNSQGMIEDFIKFLIPADDNLVGEAKDILHKLEGNQLQKYKPIHSAKALVHTWLAWQEDPGTPLGLAITKKYLTTNNVAICNKFMDWLVALFTQ